MISTAAVKALHAAGGPHMQLLAGLFPAPWSALSGGRVERLAGAADALGVKLYTMHWPTSDRSPVRAPKCPTFGCVSGV